MKPSSEAEIPRRAGAGLRDIQVSVANDTHGDRVSFLFSYLSLVSENLDHTEKPTLRGQ